MTPQEQLNRAQGDTNKDQGVTNAETEGHFRLLELRLEQLEKESGEKVLALEKKVAALQADKESALRWGLMTLGSAVLAMGYFLAKLALPGFFK